MKLEEITKINIDPTNTQSHLHFPGEFIYGSALIMEDNCNLEELMSSCGWDCFSAACTIIKEEDIEPLKKEFNTYLSEYVEKCIENQMPEEDVTSLLIYKIDNHYYYAFILYTYESEYAVNTFDGIGYEEDKLLYIGGDNNDYDLIDSIVYELFDNCCDEDGEYEDNNKKMCKKFQKIILPWVENNPNWQYEYKLLTEGWDDNV